MWEKEYKDKGVKWIIAEQFPYEPAFGEAKEVLESGAIGELRSFEMQWLNWMPHGASASLELGVFYSSNTVIIDACTLGRWEIQPDRMAQQARIPRRGACLPSLFLLVAPLKLMSSDFPHSQYILDGGVHFVAALRWMLSGLNLQISSLSSVSSQQQSHLPRIDTVHSLVRLSSLSSSSSSSTIKASGSFVLSVAHENPSPPIYEFRGSKATLRIQLGEQWSVSLLGEKGKVLLQEDKFESRGVKEEMRAFGKALEAADKGDEGALQEIMRKSGPRAALKDVAVIEAALTSAEQEKWIKVEA